MSNKYISVELMSTKQYLAHIEAGYWGGKVDPHVLEIIKDNPDNPYLSEEIKPYDKQM